MVLNYMQVIAIILFANSIFALGFIIGYLTKKGERNEEKN